MNQADKDAQKWMEAHSRWQYKKLVEAKETGQQYYIDGTGCVIVEKGKDEPEQVQG
jgi:hypothetical protein